MTKEQFRTGVMVSVDVFLRQVGLSEGPMSEEDLWFAFAEFVQGKSLSTIVEDNSDDDIPF